MPHGRPGGAQNPFKFETGEYVRIAFVVIKLFQAGWIKRLTAGAEYN